MKKILKVLTIIPIYCILFILANCRILFSNFQNDIALFNSVYFLNLNIIISTLSLYLITFIKKNNKFRLSFCLLIIGITFLNGIFIGDNLSNYIYIYYFLIYNSYVYSCIFNKKFELALVQSTSIILIFLVLLGVCNLLKLLPYVLIAYIIVSFIIVLKTGKFSSENFKQLNSKSLIIFTIFFIIAIIGGINRYVHTYDEFSHWAFDAKAVIQYDKLSTCQEIASYTRSYPPVLTLWHYLLNVFIEFSEQNLYIGLSIFISIFTIPMFSLLEKKNNGFLVLLSALSFSACFLLSGVYGYGTLYADLPLSVVFFTTFVIFDIFKNDFKALQRNLSINFILLSLIKPSGFLLGIAFLIILMFDEYLKLNEYKLKFKHLFKNILIVIKKYFKLIIASVGAFAIWSVYVKICNKFLYNIYDAEILPQILETSVAYKLNSSVLIGFFKNLLSSLDDTILFGIVEISLWQFIIIVFSTLILINFLKVHDFKKSILRVLPIFVGYLVFFVLTLLSIFVMFSVYETEKLASFGRYLNAFHYAILMYILFIVSKKNFLATNKNKIFTLIIYGLILINIPFTKLTYFASDYSDRKNTIDFNYSMKDRFDRIIDIVPEDSSVFVLDQNEDDGIMAMWHSRYYLFPRKVNASSKAITWKIRTEKNKDDLKDWGLTANKFEQHLIEYDFDYLYLYSYDEEMLEKIDYMIKGVYKDKILFKIEKYESNVELIPII